MATSLDANRYGSVGELSYAVWTASFSGGAIGGLLTLRCDRQQLSRAIGAGLGVEAGMRQTILAVQLPAASGVGLKSVETLPSFPEVIGGAAKAVRGSIAGAFAGERTS